MEPYGNIYQGHQWLIACCMMALGHHLNQCWFLIIKVLWYSSECVFSVQAQFIILYNEFENYTFKLLPYPLGPRGQWVNDLSVCHHRYQHTPHSCVNGDPIVCSFFMGVSCRWGALNWRYCQSQKSALSEITDKLRSQALSLEHFEQWKRP